MKFYFTYGSGHLTKDGQSLGNRYTVIEAEGEAEARDKMFKARDAMWAFTYRTEKELNIVRWNLKEISLEDATLELGELI